MVREPVIDRVHPSEPYFTTQKIYRFDNDYGASVIHGEYSYGGLLGLWELAVIRFSGEDNGEFYLVYDTPITGDVLGHLSWEEVEETLNRIEEL